jgi:hypothetical protein
VTCPAVIEVITPGPPGPTGGGITLTGPAVLGRAEATSGAPVAIPLGSGLTITGGVLTAEGTNLSYDPATRLLSSSTGGDVTLPLASAVAAGLVPPGWVSGAEAAILPHIHGNLAGIVYEHVRPIGVAIGALVPYHIVGNQGDTDRVQIIAADAGDPQTMPASGILPIGLANNADGHGAVVGPITGVDTSAYAPGTTLYVAVGGGLTATMPAGNVQMVAVVGRSHVSTGSVVPLIGPVLAPVGYTGAYADLSGKPAIPSSPGDIGAATAAQGAKADTAVQPAALSAYTLKTDSRLSDAREWTASVVTQPDAEAGVSTVPVKWTPERWRQAAAAWWLTVSTAAGRALATAADVAAQRALLGIPPAVGTPTGVMITAANIPTLTGITATSNRIHYMKIRVDSTSTPSQILCRTNTTYVGTSVVQLGIYANVNNRAGNRLYTSGNITIDVPVATASANYAASVTGVTLTPGWYWLAFCVASVGTTPSFLGGGNNTNGVGFPYFAEFTTAGASMSSLLEVAATLPAVANGLPNGTGFPAAFLLF